MRRDPDRHPPESHPYRARPPAGTIARRADEVRGDAAILLGIAAVSALPFVGLAIGRAVESWEVGAGTLGVLLAVWAVLEDWWDAREERGEAES